GARPSLGPSAESEDPGDGVLRRGPFGPGGRPRARGPGTDGTGAAVPGASGAETEAGERLPQNRVQGDSMRELDDRIRSALAGLLQAPVPPVPRIVPAKPERRAALPALFAAAAMLLLLPGTLYLTPSRTRAPAP